MLTDRDLKPVSPLSIVICAFNAIEYTKLLVESIRKHSRYAHEIVIYSDGSSDETLAWLREQVDIVWQHDRRNRGICSAMNRAARMATREYLFFPNTDHVLASGWDENLLRRLSPRTVVSCQCIEPGTVPVAKIFHVENCGTRSDEFDEKRFNEAVARLARPDETPGVNYPFAVSKALWDELGGLDLRFDPGPANDPDFFYRLTFAGARMVRAEDVIIYHFSGKSSRMAGDASREHEAWHELTERNEARFADKWGERYRYANGGLPDPGPEARRRWEEMSPARPTVEVRSRMRVLLDARTMGPKENGIGTYTLNLVRALSHAKEAPLITLISRDSERLRDALGALERVEIETLGDRGSDMMSEREAIARLARDKKSEVFHGPAFAVPAGLGVPSVVTVHDLAFRLFPEWYPQAFVDHLSTVLSESVAAAAQIIVVSESAKEDLIRAYPGIARRARRIYEALPEAPEGRPDRQELKAVRSKYGGEHGYILTVGVQQRRKNAVNLVLAFSRLREQIGLRQRLVLVGGTECEDERLPLELKALGIESSVLLTPHLSRTELGLLYFASDLFVYPSFYEGFGLPVLEAMAREVPVACSRGGSLAEVAGEAAKFFSPEDPASIAVAMREVLTDPAEAARLVSLGKENVKRFSWDEAARETLETYRKAMDTTLEVTSGGPPRSAEGCPSGGEPYIRVREGRSRPRIAVDTRLLGHERLGTGRYTAGILYPLIEQAGEADFVLIGPKSLDAVSFPENASVLQHVAVGPETLLDPAWEQYSLPTHLLGCDVYLSPTGLVPVARPCKAIPVIHDLGFLDHPEHFDPSLREHLEPWIRNACLSADRVITVSEFTRDRVVERYGTARERIRVVHHGRPGKGALASLSSTKGQPVGEPQDRYVLCVSSFEPNKNLPMLIDAFQSISRKWPGKLVLAGRAGRDSGRVQERVASSGLEKRIVVRQNPEDRELAALYSGASLFLFPSLYEGFGLPLVEAMAAGLPVIANHAASCPEVVGGGGILLEDRSPEAWAGAMSEVLSDSDVSSQLSRKASERASAFSWERAARETWSVIQECLEAK